MDVSKFHVISAMIYLRDISKDFAALEGEVERAQQAYVTVRQATEEDSIRRASLVSKRQVSFTGGQYSEAYDDNPRERMMRESHWTLAEVGNITTGDRKPLFKNPAHDMTLGEFRAAWGQLPRLGAEAIHKAVLTVNVDWDIFGIVEEPETQPGAEGEKSQGESS